MIANFDQPLRCSIVNSIYNPLMRSIFYFLIVCLIFQAGCSSQQGLSLTSRNELKPNLGQIVRIDGIAHFQSITGPAIATDNFEVRVYPRTLWGADVSGKRVSVVGKLLQSTVSTPPDPSVNPGEYWLSESTFTLTPSEKP